MCGTPSGLPLLFLKTGIGIVRHCGAHYGEKFLLVNTLASSSKQAAQAKVKGLRSLLCAIIPPFGRVFLHPRPNGRPNRLKTRFSATVRVSSLPFPPELSAVRITDRVSGTRARIPLPSGSTPCAGIPAYRHKVSCKMPFLCSSTLHL